MAMELNNYPLSHNLQIGIQGLVGELVGLEYVLNNLIADKNDEIKIVTNRRKTIKRIFDKLYPNKANPLAINITYNESPLEFFNHALVDNFHKIGCEGIDFTNADVLAESLFDNYMSKTKKQILSELQRNGRLYRKEIERAKEESERRIKAQRDECERRIKERENVDNDNEWYRTMISEFVNTLSHEDLAKILTLIELEKIFFEKGVSSISAFKISHLNTFRNYFLQKVEWVEHDYENRRNTIKIISEYANDKFEEWYLFSSVFNCLNLTKNKPDIMIVHSHGEKLNKLILIECKCGEYAGLSPNQNDCIDCIKKIKSDKVEYKKINVDYQAPKQLIVSEISD